MRVIVVAESGEKNGEILTKAVSSCGRRVLFHAPRWCWCVKISNNALYKGGLEVLDLQISRPPLDFRPRGSQVNELYFFSNPKMGFCTAIITDLNQSALGNLDY